MNGHFLFLGTGASMGIPVIGCRCPVCRSDSPCNKRTRPSGLITVDKQKILIDVGPDFRYQALTHHIDHIDGVFLTHAHHDHTASLDELRVFYMRSKHVLPCLLSQETALDIQTRYAYIFGDPDHPEKLISRISLQVLPGDRGETSFLGLKVSYFTYEQAKMKVTGFRLGNFAYVSDIRTYPESIFDDLKGVQVLVISALRFEPSPFHLGIDEAVDFSRRMGASSTWLTHIAHELDHEATNAYLPPNVRMAYDGLEIYFKIDE